MKSRDRILFTFPIVLGVCVAIIAVILFQQVSHFDDVYIKDQESAIEDKANLISDVITPMISRGDAKSAVEYCNTFMNKETRLTLIDPAGTVVSDSLDPNHVNFDNHSTRPEVVSAAGGVPLLVTRFSNTRNVRTIYYALPIKSNDGSLYVLRISRSNSSVESLIKLGKRNTLIAIILGAVGVLLFTGYIILRIRRPLEILQEDAFAISMGELRRKIIVPDAGIVRELALTVSRMAEQLKAQIIQITDDRNAREFIFNALSEGALQVERDGNVVMHNPEAAKIFGLTWTGKTSAHLNMSRCGSPEILRMMYKIFEDGVPREREIQFDRGGKIRTLFVRGGLVSRNEEKYLILTISDLTDLRALESFRSDFITNVSHEIKTPLTSILSAVESLRDGAVKNPEFAEKFLTLLDVQASRLNLLVQDILSLAALERKEISGEKEFVPFRLDSAVENSVNLCRHTAEKAGIELEEKYCGPVEILGDSQLIEQVVVNLIGNAVKYSGSKKIEISLSENSGNAVLAVKDFGCGITAEHLPRLFERFYRVHKERSRKLGGTGLGLAIVKHIAQLHGGSASVESKLGAGTTFKVTLPISESEAV